MSEELVQTAALAALVIEDLVYEPLEAMKCNPLDISRENWNPRLVRRTEPDFVTDGTMTRTPCSAGSGLPKARLEE